MFEKVYCDVIHHDLEIMSSHRPALVVAGLIERTVFRDTVCDEITARAWKISLARSLLQPKLEEITGTVPASHGFYKILFASQS